jgi:hypothetical protein
MSASHLLIEKLAKKQALGIVVAVAVAAWQSPALAYRPFDGTDAAVAAKGEMEIELQPAGRLRDQSGTSLIAPAAVINYGFAEDWEAVLEGQGQTPLSPIGPTSLSAAGAFLKHVVVPGTLQNKSGPSIAAEFGVLLPNSIGGSGVGASLAGIVSQRWDWGTIHLNLETALTRDHHGDVFLSTIIEGPSKWTVRPVAEVFYENEFGEEETFSGLVGLIYTVRDNLNFDIAIRHALTNGHAVNEIRAGVTFGFPISFFEDHAVQHGALPGFHR